MEIDLNFNTKRKLIIDWFYETDKDNLFCKIFNYRKNFVFRFLWFKFEFSTPGNNWSPDDGISSGG